MTTLMVMRHLAFKGILTIMAIAPDALAQMPVQGSRAAFEVRSSHLSDIGLQDAMSRALASSPVLRGAHDEIAATAGAALQAGLRLNPVLSTEVEDTRRNTRKTTVMIGIPLELYGQRNARIVAADAGTNAAVAELASTRSDVLSTVAQAYFDVMAAQERISLSQATLEVAKKVTEIAGKRVSAGKAPPIDATRARLAQSNSELELGEAKADLEAARYALAATWGSREPDFGNAVADLSSFPDRPEWNVLKERLARSPQFEMARAEVTKRQTLAALEQSRRHVVPTLSIGTKRDQEVSRTEFVVGLSVPLPLFDRNQGNIVEAKSRANKASNALEATQVRLSMELQRASAKLGAAHESSRTLESVILPGAQDAYHTATRGFEAGKFGFIDVLDSQRTYFQARMQYLQVLANAYAAAATIDRILGTPP